MSTFANIFPHLTLWRLAKFDESKIKRDNQGQFADKAEAAAAPADARQAQKIEQASLARVEQLRGQVAQMRGAITAKLGAAQAAESALTGLVSNLAGQFGGKLVGLNHRLKSAASVETKLIRRGIEVPGKPMAAQLAGMKDLVRYTMVLPQGDYKAGAEATIAALAQQGWTPIDQDNFWQDGNIYKGINFAFENPAKVRFELQFHTPDSVRVKDEESHPLFQKAREPDLPAAEKNKLMEKMRQIWAKVQSPVGAATIGIGRMMTL